MGITRSQLLSTPPAPARTRRIGPLMLALIVQAGVLFVTAFIVVLVPPAHTEPEFTATPTIFLPQRELEHRVAVAEFNQTVSGPPVLERLTTAALLPDGLPPMPTLAQNAFSPVDISTIMPSDPNALLGQAGLAGPARSAAPASASAFFGIEDAGERVVIVVNTSVSVVNKAARRGVSIERIQQEMIDLVESLPANALFGIVQFSQGVRTFEDFLAPATRANKDAVRQWVPANLRGNPRALPNQRFYGHEAAFAAAFALQPEVIFLVTDGQLNRREGQPGRYTYPEIPYAELMRTLRDLQREGVVRTRIHVIGFEMERSAADGMRRLTREYGGQLREF